MRIYLSVTAALLAAYALSVNAQALDPDGVAGGAQRVDVEWITRLASRYEHGEGVGRDYAMAHRLYCRAARDGYAQAQFLLGWMYANGRGVDQDERIASALFERAAQAGHEHAQRMLRYVRADHSAPLPPCMREEQSPSLKLSVELTSSFSSN